MPEKFSNGPEPELQGSTFFEEHTTPKGIKCEFFWKVEPKLWVGLTPSELVKIVQELADFNKISPDNQKKMVVHFGDNQIFTHFSDDYESPIETDYHGNGVQIPDYANLGRGKLVMTRSDVVFNRSLELFLGKNGKQVDEALKREPIKEDYIEVEGTIVVTIRSAEEYLITLMAEEINHSAVNFKLVDEEKRFNAQNKYRKLIEQRVFGLTERSPSPDLLESTASRSYLKVLSKWFAEKNPERSAFFERMYQLSVHSRKAVAVRSDFDLTELFVRTDSKR